MIPSNLASMLGLGAGGGQAPGHAEESNKPDTS